MVQSPMPKSRRILHHARLLRAHTTDAEQRLWSRLRAKQLLGHKFRRQYPFRNYIADFTCVEARLIVEVDGGQHAEAVAQDDARDALFRAGGFRVLRFWNNQVLQETDAVLMTICQALEEAEGRK